MEDVDKRRTVGHLNVVLNLRIKRECPLGTALLTRCLCVGESFLDPVVVLSARINERYPRDSSRSNPMFFPQQALLAPKGLTDVPVAPVHMKPREALSVFRLLSRCMPLTWCMVATGGKGTNN